MAEVIRFPDPERKSRNPDAVDRDPAEAVIIILPIVRVESYDDPPPRRRKRRPF